MTPKVLRMILSSKTAMYSGVTAMHSVTRACAPSLRARAITRNCSMMLGFPARNTGISWPSGRNEARRRAGGLGDGDVTRLAHGRADQAGHRRLAPGSLIWMRMGISASALRWDRKRYPSMPRNTATTAKITAKAGIFGVEQGYQGQPPVVRYFWVEASHRALRIELLHGRELGLGLHAILLQHVDAHRVVVPVVGEGAVGSAARKARNLSRAWGYAFIR